MYITKGRIIVGDLLVILAAGMLYFATDHFTQNVLGLSLVIVLLLVRSIFWHYKYYKATGKIY